MNTSNNMTARGDGTSDASLQPPAGITLQQLDGSLVMSFKENKVWGIVLLIMSAWFIITVAAYSIKLEGVPVTEYMGQAGTGGDTLLSRRGQASPIIALLAAFT